jgi:hypothetical protein
MWHFTLTSWEFSLQQINRLAHKGERMFKLGKRTVIKQGGSYMISLPMTWMKSMDTDVKTVRIEMDCENQLKIIAGDTSHENTVH